MCIYIFCYFRLKSEYNPFCIQDTIVPSRVPGKTTDAIKTGNELIR